MKSLIIPLVALAGLISACQTTHRFSAIDDELAEELNQRSERSRPTIYLNDGAVIRPDRVTIRRDSITIYSRMSESHQVRVPEGIVWKRSEFDSARSIQTERVWKIGYLDGGKAAKSGFVYGALLGGMVGGVLGGIAVSDFCPFGPCPPPSDGEVLAGFGIGALTLGLSAGLVGAVLGGLSKAYVVRYVFPRRIGERHFEFRSKVP